MKPGYLTTEFWVVVASKLLALLALFGVIKSADVTTLTDALGQIAGAVAIIVAQAMVAIHYVHSRTQAKRDDGWTVADASPVPVEEQKTVLKPPTHPLLWIGLLLPLMLPSAAYAEATKTSVQIGLVVISPTCRRPRQPAPAPAPAPQTDPNVTAAIQAQTAALQQLSQQHSALLSALAAQAGQKAPSVIVIPQSGSAPLITPPVSGSPLITPPVSGPPLITPPVSGPPVITPPVSGPPVVTPPVGGAPLIVPPVTGPPTPTPIPPAATAPSGFLRLTATKRTYALYRPGK
jgi:hypothetical protein